MFRQFVVKIASRCDLACDHCYVYEHADQSWRGRPRVMPADVMESAVARIAEHAAAHHLPRVTVVLHGGEPLLAGVERIRTLARGLREALPTGCKAGIRIQTNGLQLNDAFCEMFRQEDIGVGISIDGDRIANDRHRRHANGRTSYPELVRAIQLVGSEQYRSIFNGLLCTVDVENDPVAVFDALAAFTPPRIEFLLPHATWVEPPPGAQPGQARYAAWLLAVHQRWTECGRPMDVRLFRSVSDLLAGRSSRTEAIGLEPADIVVVETDGTIEQADSLKTAFDGAPATGFDVVRHSFDEAAAHPGFDGRRAGAESLSPICQRCPAVRICGGGLYAHRFDGTGFSNPSVYCRDLYTFITGLTGQTRQTSPISRHRMSPADFSALGRGEGSESGVAALKAAQVSKARMRLAQLAKPLQAERSWTLVRQFDAADRNQLNRVLADPFLMPADGTAARGPGGTLTRIALGCAVLSSEPVEADLAVAEDVLSLPGVGALPVTAGPVHVRVAETSAITVNGVSAEAARHTVCMGPVRIRIEDHDPARDRFGHPVTGPLTSAELDAWRDGLDATAVVLAKRHPEALAEMAEGLTTIVPLQPQPGRQRSATARNAFGALGIALPAPTDGDVGEALACLVLHEFQHLKLGAVLDMFDLHDRTEDAETAGYRVAWRPGPRSLEAVLQGAYAHISVVEYWRRRAQATQGPHSREYARRSEDLAGQVEDALSQITTSVALTRLGRRWVADMAATVAGWR
ncbi:uncharacterized protein ABIA31_005478 [Catenulispora sp. MAP5-51]|uniref:FxsB family cyclophane-forming radical SAM/SPASM peptide maturase n=1 Tax=Catenulispora sp. MAP5-51 TaxID=3156298 RepID=UPI00351132C2